MRNRNESSDESEVSDSSINSRKSFRVSVCLRHYFQDHRARCYMQVSRGRRVRWLEKRIRKVFSLSDVFSLRSDGHLLPSSEPLSILAPGDSIEVIPLKEGKGIDYVNNGISKEIEKISDSTCITANTNSTLSRNEELIQTNTQYNGNIEQSSESVFNINSSEIHDNANDSEHIHRMETDLSDSMPSVNDRTEDKQQDMYDEPDGTLDTLQEMKQQALKLLDSEGGPERRARRRVRRRPRRTTVALPACPTPTSVLGIQEGALLSDTVHPKPHIRFSSTSPPPPAPLPSPEVERNEAASARLPRIIRPLAAD